MIYVVRFLRAAIEIRHVAIRTADVAVGLRGCGGGDGIGGVEIVGVPVECAEPGVCGVGEVDVEGHVAVRVGAGFAV